jgi:hypothetical protein
MLGLAVLLAPAATVWWGPVGYLVGSATSMVVYSIAVLALPGARRGIQVPVGAPVRS